MNTINKKVLLLASSIILITNDTQATRNNGKAPTAEDTATQTVLSSASKHAISGKKKPKTCNGLTYLKSLQFGTERRLCPSFTYRTAILTKLRDEKWTFPTNNQQLIGELQALDFAIQECYKYKKFDRLAEIIKLCFERDITPNQGGLEVAQDSLEQEIKTTAEKLHMLTATQSLINQMDTSSFKSFRETTALQWIERNIKCDG